MRYTQREVMVTTNRNRPGCPLYYFLATTEAEMQVRELHPEAVESPILFCPRLLFFYFLNQQGTPVLVEIHGITARPFFVADDPRNFQDDAAYFMKFPQSAELDES